MKAHTRFFVWLVIFTVGGFILGVYTERFVTVVQIKSTVIDIWMLAAAFVLIPTFIEWIFGTKHDKY